MAPPDIMKLDLYGILGVSVDASEKEIVKAYRKKALKCHPDKNPDNPEAVELFQELSKALEILTDAAARAAFDKARKAKEAANLRHKKLDSERKRFKEDLELREQAAQSQTAADYTAARNLQAEIERLRKEGSKLLEQEQELLKKQLSEERESDEHKKEAPARIKVKWKAKKDDETNGGYDKEFLQNTFQNYGEVTALVISSKKPGSAIIEFSSPHDALQAVQRETGNPGNPLTLTWISGQPGTSQDDECKDTTGPGYSGLNPVDIPLTRTQIQSDSRDFESLVLMKMRQAEERKRLIEEMKKEEEDKT